MPFPNPDTQFKTGSQQVEIARKGGQARTPAKSLAAKLRHLRKKGLSEENAQKLYELMTDPDISSLDLLMNLQALRNDLRTVRDRENFVKLLMEWHKLRHGTKLNIESKSLVLDKKDFTFTIEVINPPGGVVPTPTSEPPQIIDVEMAPPVTPEKKVESTNA